MSQDKEILTLLVQGNSQRHIAAALHVSRNTVAKIANAVKQYQLQPQGLLNLTEEQMHKQLFPAEELELQPAMPNFSYIHKELLRNGVTLKLLWEEYVDQYRTSSKPYLRYSQFCKRYRDYVEANNLTMHIRHKPGDRIMVDWAGTKLRLGNPASGQASFAYLFVAVLPFSMYCYAEAMPDEKMASWICAHIHAFQYFGGTARLLVCDNLKTGVICNRKHEDPLLHPVYKELAAHYNTALLPARVLAPKDKAAVEGTVGNLTTAITARLRNSTFLTLKDLNRAVAKELDTFNERPFTKREGSRRSVFLEEEQVYLHPLPTAVYEYADWTKATVGPDYHICVDHQYYSVPYQYVRKKVDVRLTGTTVEAFYQKTRIAMHARLTGKRHQYSTIAEHMPQNHQLYSLWDGKRFLRWAESVGPSTEQVIRHRLQAYQVEEQSYKSCIALLKLAETYTPQRLEQACALALSKDQAPRYNFIHGILQRKLDIKEQDTQKKLSQHAFIRGAAYYGGQYHEK